MDIKDEMRQLGYSKEDEYFFKKDQELIEKMREAANLRKQELAEQHKDKAFWMTCPKCGNALQEETLDDVVRVDSCSACGGMYFDRGELDLLVKAKFRSLIPR